ncbi:CfaE/CblD family pilus tip adhesin [Stenotrophomonas sp.]|uniref:CfaE/CblD family pilus tip adhesin n=1 Tax=Stenotrophomonas sp. TaxID=69392 RepID=UPI00289C9DE9|nr:CfaE/CblD family pilus tip adhesin [Stenotrophomonas sp.]
MIVRVVLRILLLLLPAADACAQRPPVTVPPGGVTRVTVAHGFDRSAPQGLELWAVRTVLGYDESAQGHGRLHVTCTDDPARGHCPQADTGQGPVGPAPLRMEFTEQRSGQRVTLALTGSLERIEWERTCSDDYWDKAVFPLWTSEHRDCHMAPTGTAATLVLDASEIVQLVAGRWHGELHLDVRRSGGPLVGRHEFVLEIAVSDHTRATLHLPAYGSSSGQLQLPLDYRALPLPASIGGSATLELCLYDGVGAHSPRVLLSAHDTGQGAASHFSIWHEDGGEGLHDRIDYHLRLQHGEREWALDNHAELSLDDMERAPLRAVTLPGLPYPVYCVPMTMTLRVPRVPAADKREGRYQGGLVLRMRLPTRRP